jgi:16S rRNA (guanine1207-N2)-methyltransferase
MERRYTQVISNPPFHTGITVNDQVTQAFVAQAYQVLEPGGQLWLVANRFLRYERMVEGIFQKVEIVAANSRYQVFQAFK